MRLATSLSSRALRAENLQRLELLSQHFRRVSAQPSIDQRRIHLAEIGGGFEIVAKHQVAETRRRSVEPALDGVADDEIHLRRSVVSAEAGVLGHAPAEL